MVMVKANKHSMAAPGPQDPGRDGKLNEELAKAGVLLVAEGAPADLQGRASAFVIASPGRLPTRTVNPTIFGG